MIDRILAGRYKVVSTIGEGGMSRVWRAQDLNTGKYVAVKVLREEFRDDETFVRRFEREAQAASRMTHPNIAGLLDVGLEEDGTRYLVIEYVSGKTLKEFIRESGTVRPELAAQIIIRVLAAVQHAHQNGVVHRDIKPQNILIDREGTVKVSDFGIARVANSQTMSQDTETVMGSVYYFSPEQAKGAAVDEKSDIYSVGVVFYEMLTGQVPFTGDSPVAIAMKHLQDAPVPPSEVNPAVSPALDYVVLHAMEKRPRNRYASASEMLRDVRLALEHPDTILAARAELERQEREARSLERRKKKAEKRVRLMRRILVGTFSFLLLVVTAVVGYSIMERILLSRTNEIEVPSVIKMHRETAYNDLRELGLDPYVRVDEFDLAPEADDVVYEQSIAPGTFVQPGTQITIMVCKSRYDIRMPNVTNIAYDAAASILDSRGIVVESIEREVSKAEYNIVIRQSVAAGTGINEGDSVVLTVSMGSINMPRLIDLTQERAEQVIANYGLLQTLEERIVDDPAKVGVVIDQMPPMYKDVARNTIVTIWVGIASDTLYRGDIQLDLTSMPDNTTLKVVVTDRLGEEIVSRIETFDKSPGEYTMTVHSKTNEDAFYTIYYNDERAASGVVSFSR